MAIGPAGDVLLMGLSIVKTRLPLLEPSSRLAVVGPFDVDREPLDVNPLAFQSLSQFRQVFTQRIAGGFAFGNDARLNLSPVDTHFESNDPEFGRCQPHSDLPAFRPQLLECATDTLDQLRAVDQIAGPG
jgi:hypothetical protein